MFTILHLNIYLPFLSEGSRIMEDISRSRVVSLLVRFI